MHKKLLFICLSLLSVCRLHAQGFKVELSEEYTEPKNSYLYDVSGYDADGFYVTRFRRAGFNTYLIMERFDNSLKYGAAKEFENSVDGEDLDYYNAIQFNDKLYALSEWYSKKTKVRSVYAEGLADKTMHTNGDPQLLVSMADAQSFTRGFFQMDKSPDEKMLVFYGLPGYYKSSIAGFTLGNKEISTAKVAVYSGNMEKMWEKEFELPYSEKLYDAVAARVDNDGNFYWMGKLYKEGTKNKKKGEPNYSYVINAFRNDGKDKKEYTISLGDRFITDCTFKISNEGKLICTGFYSDKGVYGIKGIFYMTINPESKEVELQGTKEFDTEFLASVIGTKRAEKGKEIYNYDLDNIVLRDDGGAVLLAEQFYVVESTFTLNGKTTTTITYHTDNIIVVNVNPDNSIQWATIIPKRQASGSTFYLSYAYDVRGSNIYLVFNDNEKNITEKDEDRIYPYDGRKSIATIVTINGKGDWDKKALFSNKEEGVILRPSACKQLNDDEMILYAEKGRDYKIGKVIFK